MAALLPWADIETRRLEVPRHVVYRRFASETVLLNIQTGHYHGLDEIGDRFFDKLQQAPTVGEAVISLAQEFEQPWERIRKDMVTFCSELAELGLIELRTAS